MPKRVLTNEQIDQASSALTDDDLAVLSEVDSSIAKGLQLKAWSEKTHAVDSYSYRFPTALTLNRPDLSFAFLDEAPMNDRMMPVMGDFQDLFYDRIKAASIAPLAAAGWMRDQ